MNIQTYSHQIKKSNASSLNWCLSSQRMWPIYDAQAPSPKWKRYRIDPELVCYTSTLAACHRSGQWQYPLALLNGVMLGWTKRIKNIQTWYKIPTNLELTGSLGLFSMISSQLWMNLNLFDLVRALISFSICYAISDSLLTVQRGSEQSCDQRNA